MMHASRTSPLLAALLAAACSSADQGPSRDAGPDGVAAADARRDGAGDGARPADAQGPTCAPVTVEFVGEVATVAKTPLGLDDGARTTAVSGSFAYLPCVADGEPDDPRRGEYDHRGGAVLELSVAGLTIRGSGNPLVDVEDLDPDTFRLHDGPQLLDEDQDLRVVEVDGERRPAVKVRFSITDGKGAAFASDALPPQFPFLDLAEKEYPHTFSVADDGGTLLLRLSSLTQR